MANFNAQLLADSGWSDTHIDRFFKILDRKIKHGLFSLTVADRRLYNAGQAVRAKSNRNKTARAVAAAKTKGVAGKLHYRFEEASLEAFKIISDLAPLEVSAQVLIRQEYLDVLEIFQPVLDTCDTTQRNKISNSFVDFLALALDYPGARKLNVNREDILRFLQDAMEKDWNNKWNELVLNTPANDSVAFPREFELEFREFVREEIERLVLSSFPSLRRI